MSARDRRVPVYLDDRGVKRLDAADIKTILRAADPLIAKGGRTMLTRILRGSRAKEVLAFELDRNPSYGAYRHLSDDEVLGRIDWMIRHDYLEIEYSGRLPFLVYTPRGWAIERETYANELLAGFNEMLRSPSGGYVMAHLKDRNRELIWLLLDKVRSTRNPQYIPLLEAWARVDYKKVSQGIRQVIAALQGPDEWHPEDADDEERPKIYRL